MNALVIGLLLGAGVYCIWWSMWPQSEEREAVAKGPSLKDRTFDLLKQAGYDSITPSHLVSASIASGFIVLVMFFALTQVFTVSLCFAAIAAWLPFAIVQSRARKRRGVLRDLWPDAVDNVASAVRAGLALPEALSQLAIRGPEELRPAFGAFAEDYRTTGRFHDCLDRLKDRLADPVGDRLVESLRIAREVGGSDLGRLLRTLSSFLREDSQTRAELETRQSWTVNAARLACGAPWVVLAMLATRGESLAAYSTPAGTLVLIIGAGVSIVAYRLMIRLGRLPEDQRVLR